MITLEEEIDNYKGLIEDARTKIKELESKILIDITVEEVNRFGKNSTLIHDRLEMRFSELIFRWLSCR